MKYNMAQTMLVTEGITATKAIAGGGNDSNGSTATAALMKKFKGEKISCGDLRKYLYGFEIYRQASMLRKGREVHKIYVDVHKGVNFLDDRFTLTEFGKMVLDNGSVRAGRARNVRQIVVARETLYCSGTGGCKRACGGYGSCISGCDKIKVRGHKCSFRVKLTMRLGFVDCWFVEILGSHNYYVEDGTPSDIASMVADYDVKSSDGEDSNSLRSSPLVDSIGSHVPMSHNSPAFHASSQSPHHPSMLVAPAHCPINVPVFPESYFVTMARHAAACAGISNGGTPGKSPMSPLGLALKRENCHHSMIIPDMMNGFASSAGIPQFGLLANAAPSALSPQVRETLKSPSTAGSRHLTPEPLDAMDLSTAPKVKEEMAEEAPQDLTLCLPSLSSKSSSISDQSLPFVNQNSLTAIEDDSDTFHRRPQASISIKEGGLKNSVVSTESVFSAVPSSSTFATTISPSALPIVNGRTRKLSPHLVTSYRHKMMAENLPDRNGHNGYLDVQEMDEVSDSSENSSEPQSDGELDKELIDRVKQLEAHVTQLRNIVLKKEGKKTEGQKKVKKQREFDFNRYHTRHVALKVAYLGWDYHGFVVQEDTDKTIEAAMFEALLKTRLVESRETSNYHRCGRTDKGVSALGQVISLDLRTNLLKGVGVKIREGGTAEAREGDKMSEIPYVRILNKVLPPEIRVLAWAPVETEFSARFSCKKRTYKYFFPKGNLNLELMKEAISKLVGEHDFRNLCKMDVGNGVVNFTRKILKASVGIINDEEKGFAMCELTVVGQAFLWHQIRCIVSVLFLVAQGKEDTSIIDELLDIEKNPRKPQYSMGLEIPLCLYDCDFGDDLEWIYEADWHEDNIKHLQQLWAQYTVRATMIKRMLDELDVAKVETESDIAPWNELSSPLLQQSEWLIPGNKTRIYKPLLKRQFCESLEERVEHFAKRKKISSDPAMETAGQGVSEPLS